MKRVEVTDAAAQDVHEILHFSGSPTRLSDRTAAQIEEALLHLCLWPHSGHPRSDLTPHDVLFWLIKPYFIVYQLRDELLTVIAVLHTSRNIPYILRSRAQSGDTSEDA